MYLITITPIQKTVDIKFEGTLDQAKNMAVKLSQKDSILSEYDVDISTIVKILISHINDDEENTPVTLWTPKEISS